MPDELHEAMDWTEERLSAGEPVALAPLVEKAVRRWSRPDDASLEPASLALTRLARLVESAARLRVPEARREAEEPEEEAAGPFVAGDELLDRLAALEEFKDVVRTLKEYQVQARRKFTRGTAGAPPRVQPEAPLTPDSLVEAFEAVWRRAKSRSRRVDREPVTVQERMRQILEALAGEAVPFDRLFPENVGRFEVIVTFLALLELVREGRVEARQARPLAPIFVSRRGAAPA